MKFLVKLDSFLAKIIYKMELFDEIIIENELLAGTVFFTGSV